MQPVVALSIAAGVVLLAALLGVFWKRTTGRARDAKGEAFAAGELPGLEAFAEGATLVQFSTEFCSTCPGTRRYLQQVAAERSGIAYHDVDLTHRPELASKLHILQTPTVFVLDHDGRLVSRFGGAPRRAELTAVLDTLVPTPEYHL
ncbi:MAG: thioredoxin family protein [Microbacteriaceae bacterium]|nr:thioredoxin family protein [Microbacteriaceae bacterium]